ncbi:MAG: hypothetical protein KME46_29830 [Brasilonema angustatum HA4187-MV1]|nr:hypothetical protein [Brasilonema angustatum HA4187-MV1]
MAATKLKILTLGEELDALSIYCDYSLTKKELAALLNCSRTSVVAWCDLAWRSSPSFRNDTPRDEEGAFDRQAPLSPYQIWFVSRIQETMKRVRSADRTRAYITGESTAKWYSKARFDVLHNIIQEKTA